MGRAKRTGIVSEWLHDSTADIGSSAAGLASTGGSAKIVDLGAAAAFEGKLRIYISAIEIASNSELYQFSLQGSASSTFASGIYSLFEWSVGANEVLAGDKDSTTGVYEFPVHNLFGQTALRYLRIYCTISGTVASGITYNACLLA